MKKILIIGADMLARNDAAGITLESIFENIDASFLMGITWGNRVSSVQCIPMNIVHLSYSVLSSGQMLDQPCFKKVSIKMKRSEVATQPNNKRENEHTAGLQMKKNVRQWMALSLARSKVKITRKDFATIKDFEPQVIYTVGETFAALNLSYRLSKSLNIPIVIHFMDNWKNNIEWASNPLLKGYQKKLSDYCDLCYSRTSECIAIGERMAEEYTKKSGVKHTVIMNSIETKSLYCNAKKSVKKVQFLYAGGLHLGRDEALREIGKCIDCACNDTGKQAEFLIYTSEDNISLYADEFKSLEHTKLIAAVPHNRICELYRSADVLVHVENSALTNNEFFKYSVSTKISEYLATGRPFLFWGPKGIYLLDFLRENRLAYTASCIEEAQRIVLEMLNECHNEYSENAVKYAARNFDIAVAKERFNQVIDNVYIRGN